MTADSKVQLSAENVSVSFGTDIALSDATFTISQGEFVGIVGQNGSGKTTLLRVLLGLQKPTRGQAERHKGTVIGYVPQRGHLYNGIVPMSVLEVVNLGSKGDKSVARQSLRNVGMEEHERKNFSDLSGGQQQRIIIAKALASGANVLILDEPATGVDEASQADFYTLLGKLHCEKRTIVMVSHDIDSVIKLVSRVICLNRTVIYDGIPELFKAEEQLRSEYSLHLHSGENDA